MTLTSGAAAANTQYLHIQKQSQSCIPGTQQKKTEGKERWINENDT